MHAMTPKVTNAGMDWFAAVKTIGLTFPDVEAVIRYDGTPALKARGCFMAGLATHESAEPDSLVVRMNPDESVSWRLTVAKAKKSRRNEPAF